MVHKKRLGFWAVALCFFLIMLVYNKFMPLAADDYNYTYSFYDQQRIDSFTSLFQSIKAHYFVQNGRLVPHSLLMLFRWWGENLSDILNTLAAAALTLTLYLHAVRKKKYDTLLYVTICASVFFFAPAFGQTMVWLSGSCNYLWGTLLLLAWLLPYRRMVDANDKKKSSVPQAILLHILWAIMSFAIGDVSEHMSAAVLLIAGLFTLYRLLQTKKVPAFSIVGLAFGFLGWVFLMRSPAQRLRAAGLTGGSPLTFNRLWQQFIVAMERLSANSLALILVFIVLLSLAVLQKVDQTTLFSAGVIFVGGLAAAFAMTGSPSYPLRTVFGINMLLILACGMLWPSISPNKNMNALLRAASMALLVFSFFTLARGLDTTYRTYIAWSARESHIQAEISAGNLDVLSFKINVLNDPHAIFYQTYDLEGDPAHWTNVAFAEFKGLNSIKTVEERFY